MLTWCIEIVCDTDSPKAKNLSFLVKETKLTNNTGKPRIMTEIKLIT